MCENHNPIESRQLTTSELWGTIISLPASIDSESLAARCAAHLLVLLFAYQQLDQAVKQLLDASGKDGGDLEFYFIGMDEAQARQLAGSEIKLILAAFPAELLIADSAANRSKFNQAIEYANDWMENRQSANPPEPAAKLTPFLTAVQSANEETVVALIAKYKQKVVSRLANAEQRGKSCK